MNSINVSVNIVLIVKNDAYSFYRFSAFTLHAAVRAAAVLQQYFL